MKKILMIGGDSRNKIVAEMLAKYGHTVHLIGFETCDFKNKNITLVTGNKDDFRMADAVILPVHGTASDGRISSAFSDNKFQLSGELLAYTPANCTIFSGITNDFLNKATKNRRLEVIFARDDIAIYNSISTAEATLQLAIEQTDFTIHGAVVCVIGYGRVGFTVARLFKNVGANVTVFARKDRDIARITEMGMTAKHVNQLGDLVNQFSICINTVPSLMLDETILTRMDVDALIIDLASSPGGTDFEFARQKGLKAILALGLPGKTAPKSAGNILAETILKLL